MRTLEKYRVTYKCQSGNHSDCPGKIPRRNSRYGLVTPCECECGHVKNI